MSLPIFHTDDKDVLLLQTNWAAMLNPVLDQPISSGQILKNVILVSGANSVNHKLSRKLQGWFVVRMHNNFAQIYDTQDANHTPAVTLKLNASTGVTVDLFVF
ncbi:MAG: hypothetical protein V4440_08620 [Pseudomonadota bacterium]